MADWKNWAQTVKHKNLEKVYKPGTLSQLQNAVVHATNPRRRWKLRVVGSGHAWSNLGVPSICGGAVIKVSGLNQLLGLEPLGGGERAIAEVEGGISVSKLTNKLFKEGWALPNMGDSNPQAIAGAISTETHGSGADIGSMSEFVEGMRIVKADGTAHELTTEELKAGRVSLGLLGAVYSVKLNVRRRFFLEHRQEFVENFRTENVSELVEEYPHLEYWYYPYTGRAERIKRWETEDTTTHNQLNLPEEWFIKFGAKIVLDKGIWSPEEIPKFFEKNITANRLGLPISRRGPAHEILLGKSNVWRNVWGLKTYTMEYQFPTGEGYETFWKAIDALEASIDLARDKCVFVASPIQIRFTRKSTRSILTHLRHQPTASFSISLFTRHKGAHTWLPDLERRLRDSSIGGLPHWGKMYYYEPAIDPAFEKIRRDLDPDGVFNFRQGPYHPDPEAFQDP